MNIEFICEAVHKAYCDERVRQGKEPYWTGGDYNKLDEATKDYDRATVRAVLKAISFKQLTGTLNLILNENFSGQSTLSPYAKRQADQALKGKPSREGE